MFDSFKKTLYLSITVITVITCFISLFYSPAIMSMDNTYNFNLNDINFYEISAYGFIWPTPGYTRINSYFGKRVSPTAGASNYHKGIDIGAPEGTKLLAITSGTITYTGFLGGGGYTITLSYNELKITYCHVSPIFIVKEGDEVIQGQIIGNVGPKYVYGVVRKQL